MFIISIIIYITSQNSANYLNSPNTISTTTKDTYVNEEYGYRVNVGTLGDQRLIVNDIFKNESDSPGANHGADYKSFQTHKNLALIGTIFCANTNHMQDNLNNEMPINEYAETLRNTQLSKESLPESYDEIISVIDLHKSSLGEKEAYSYVLGSKRESNIDISVYTIAENSSGKKCVIHYPIFDYKDKYDSQILETRLNWLNSFEWIE